MIFAKKLKSGLSNHYHNHGTEKDMNDLQGGTLWCVSDKIEYKMDNFKSEDY